MITELPFTPLPFFKSPHIQTVLGSYGLPLNDPPYDTIKVRIDDETELHCPFFKPKEWKQSSGIVVLLHGLTGSHRSHYMRRISSKLYRQGIAAFNMNRRGCWEFGTCRRLGHGGLTEDIRIVLQQLRKMYPDAPIQIVGFSIGGNLLLKLLGELGDEAKHSITQGIAVSPLVDLKDAAVSLGLPSNRFYERYYVDGLIALVEKSSPPIEVKFPKNCSIIAYDDHYTAPIWGYRDADDYYEKNSSSQFIENIRVPCKILAAADDPYIRIETIKKLTPPPCVERYKTAYGGHMGFIGWVNQSWSIRWMDQQVISWIQEAR